jgi:ubiquinone/menaquinone biosynthesis C-methylase UbiE
MVGGELEAGNLAVAQKTASHNRQIALVRFDAQNAPFNAASFDTVICFEAIYYFPDPDRFVAEAVRVLKPRGVLVVGTVNCAWQDFHPSPYMFRYFNNVELFELLEPHFGKIELYGGFPVQQEDFRAKIISLIKRIAMAGHLIPGSLAARAYLKRIFFGPMQPIPRQITEEIVPDERPVSIRSDEVNREFKILYAVAVK